MNRLLSLGVVALIGAQVLIGCSHHASTNQNDHHGGGADQGMGPGTDAGSGTGDLGGNQDAGTQPICTIGAPVNSRLPHVTGNGTQAKAIATVLEAILAAQTPPIARGLAYALPQVTCGNPQDPNDTGNPYQCSFAVRIDGGATHGIDVARGSAPAKDLFDALAASGPRVCAEKPDQFRIVLENMTLSATAVEYDDASSYDTVPAPDVVVHGAEATTLIQALAMAGINDCGRDKKLFLICNTFDGAPSCFFEWFALEQVGSSGLVYVCGAASGAPLPGDDLTATASATIWSALSTALKSAGYQPESGTIDQITVVNARWFRWDGSSLGFNLATGTGTPPPPM